MPWKMILFLFICALSAREVNAQNSPEGIIDTFFIELQSSGTEAALDYLYSHNPWMSQTGDAVKNLKTQMVSLEDVSYIGDYFGHDLIVEKALSPAFRLYAFLVRYDRQPIRFTFQFYKPNDVWRVYAFKYDGELDAELVEAAKLEILTREE